MSEESTSKSLQEIISQKDEEINTYKRLALFLVHTWYLESEYPERFGRGPLDIKYLKQVRDEFCTNESSPYARRDLDLMVSRALSALEKI